MTNLRESSLQLNEMPNILKWHNLNPERLMYRDPTSLNVPLYSLLSPYSTNSSQVGVFRQTVTKGANVSTWNTTKLSRERIEGNIRYKTQSCLWCSSQRPAILWRCVRMALSVAVCQPTRTFFSCSCIGSPDILDGLKQSAYQHISWVQASSNKTRFQL